MIPKTNPKPFDVRKSSPSGARGVRRQNVNALLVLVALAALLTTCLPERNNPWDDKASLNPKEWAPQNLTLTDVSITSQKLAWLSKGDDNIEGFKISRKKGSEDWVDEYHVTTKDAREWTDENITPDTKLTYTYTICAIAGENASSKIEASFTPTFQFPNNLQITKVTDISYQLNWTDNSIGEQGFKIDRRTNNEDWIIAHGIVEANQTTYIDTNVFVAKTAINVAYRVYAYHGEQQSEKWFASTNATLTPPTNLEIIPNSISSVTLNWKDNSTGEEGFKVERKFGEGSWELLTTTKNTGIDDNLFELNTTVHYRISAYIENYISDYAEESFVATIPPPSNLSITASSNTSVILSWDYAQTGHQGFKVDRKVGEDIWQEDFATVDKTQKTYTDNTVNFVVNDYYTYRVYTYYELQYSEKDEIFIGKPQGVTTTAVTSITATTATSGGNITTDGSAPVNARGLVWSTSQNPTTTSNQGITSNGSGTGYWVSELVELQPGTVYYARAYATNSVGTVYGNQQTLTTLDGVITLTTTAATFITTTTATSGGNIISDGGAAITARGVVWSTAQNPTTTSNQGITSNGTGTGSWVSELVELQLSTLYYARAYATNSVGTSYGNQITYEHQLAIGMECLGGKVAYILQPGDPGYVAGQLHGFIAAPSDQNSSAQWGCYATTIGGTSPALGRGMANTLAIVNRCSENDRAARICHDLVLNGYSDWYLPSKDELNKLYINRAAIGGFAGSNYWSSSEYSSNYAWRQVFTNGYQYEYGKDNNVRVRAVRAF